MPSVQPPDLPSFLAEDLPQERRAYQLESGPDRGKIIHFIDHGNSDGLPVILMHGNPTWCYLWRKVIGRLDPERFRCLAPDLLGFGLSDSLSKVSDHTLNRHQQAMHEWAETLRLTKGAIVVGQDWGGPLVIGIGMALPEVSGVVLANTSVLVPKRPLGTSFHKFARTPLVSDFAFRLGGFPQNILGRMQGDPESISGRVSRAYRWPLPLGRRSGPLGMARMVPSSPDHPSVPPLREIEAWIREFDGPMALVWGERDPILGRALERHVKAFPEATVTRTQAGHFLQEEVADQLAHAIEDIAAKIT
jgi:haloalkane dehalogenase